MLKKVLNHWQIIFLIGVILFFFKPFILEGKIPIPADTIVGMYHPFRDVVWDNFTAGVPFKNFLITDPVRQQLPWRWLSMHQLLHGQFPLWNQFNFSGTPLLANLQAAVFNPLNFLFAVMMPFSFTWGLQVVMQLILAGLFMYLWLRNLDLDKTACLLGSLSFSFSGFFVAWLEWNTILQVALWLPLILLAKDKLVSLVNNNLYSSSPSVTLGVNSARSSHRQSAVRTVSFWQISGNREIFKWALVLVFSESASFFSGHLQTFFYVTVVSSLYLITRLWQVSRIKPLKYYSLLFLGTGFLTFLIISIQLFPTLEFIFSSSRSFDQPLGFRTDWFLPWKHLIQLLAPDFFGNPATLNYWGNWNYGEFVSYIGVIPLLVTMVAILGRRDKKTIFFFILAVMAFVFSLSNPISFLPYQLKIPFISTTAPSRLIFIVDFSLAVLAALGLDFCIKQRKAKPALLAGAILLAVYGILWISVVGNFWNTTPENLLVAKRNLYLPTGLFISGWIMLLLFSRHSGKRSHAPDGTWRSASRIIEKKYGFWTSQNDGISKVVLLILLLFTSLDLLRFSSKFNPFVKSAWLFPKTKTLEFLQKQERPFRIASLDSRILPPNFSLMYGLETIEGYDPLYSLRYAEFWAAVLRHTPDISSFNFNRIITPQLVSSSLVNLLNVKYLLSLNEVSDKDLKLVFKEGETKVYENQKVLPRAFMVNNLINAYDKKDAINQLFVNKERLDKIAVVEDKISLPAAHDGKFMSQVNIAQYKPQKVVVSTQANNPGLLILADAFYPGWQVKVDGIREKLLRTDYILKGVVVLAGNHEVVFYYLPRIFLIGLATSALGIVFILLWGVYVWIKRK